MLEWPRSAGSSGPAHVARDVASDHRALREAAYDRLADALAACLDTRVLRELGVV